MKILLVNLTRFGDLLQSQAAITKLAAAGHEVGVVCLENFAGAATLLSGVSHVAPLPGAAFLAALAQHPAEPSAEENSAAVPRSWPGALASLARWREELFGVFPPDCICNLTPTLAARLLARFLARTVSCTGFAVDGHGFGKNGSFWAAFFQGAAACRGVSPFNVVDMFRKVATAEACAVPAEDSGASGVRSLPGRFDLRRPEEALLEEMRHVLQQQAPQEGSGFVALQLGASEDRRRWPVAYFAELGQRLWDEERLCPVLLGSRDEEHLAARYGELARHPYISLCGATDLTGLAAALCAVRMLISNDTGTMHLAAGLGIPVLAVFLATAQPFDTGPYREGSCSVEPDLPCHPCPFGTACPHDLACRRAVAPATLAGLALGYLRRGEWALPEGEAYKGRVWVSETDETGFMSLRSLSGHGGEDRTQWLLLQRRLLRGFLDRDRGRPFVSASVLPGEGVSLSPALRGELVDRLARASALAELLLQQGKTLLIRPLPIMRQKFLATWQKVHASLSQSPCLGALSVLWLEETQAEGQDLPVALAVVEQFIQLLQAFSGRIQE